MGIVRGSGWVDPLDVRAAGNETGFLLLREHAAVRVYEEGVCEHARSLFS